MEWYEGALMILLCFFFGFVLGYTYRSSQSAADAEEREQEFFDAVTREVKERTPEAAGKAAEAWIKREIERVLNRR